jgi:hypothetical protein
LPGRDRQALLKQFERWLDSLASFECCSWGGPGQKAWLEVAERSDMVTTPDHPALNFFNHPAVFGWKCFFVGDQSCIRMARDELALALQTLVGE